MIVCNHNILHIVHYSTEWKADDDGGYTVLKQSTSTFILQFFSKFSNFNYKLNNGTF